MLDALLLVSFGGPEGLDEVMPFLRNVTRGRGVSESRLQAVAEHYYHYGGVSPINEQNRCLLEAVSAELISHGLDVPVYWGNRNWRPYLSDTVAQMRSDGVRSAAAFVTSAYGGYSACWQYREDIQTAQEAAGDGAPRIVKLRQYAHHEGFIGPLADGVARCAKQLPDRRRATTRVLLSAHSIPTAMNERSGETGRRYETQLRSAGELVMSVADPALCWELVWQSRSGAPSTPWLEPDINDRIRQLAGAGVTDVIVSPIGFVSDHMEVLWDLDQEAAATAKEVGIGYQRAATPGTDPRFVSMVRELFIEASELELPLTMPPALPPTTDPDSCGLACCRAKPATSSGAVFSGKVPP
ncbi:MAG: ferrochelatase [Acidimicrobiales bacterium]|nr:MAG: ferrochelatase [Acidimicrobiales bacterium]